MDKAKLTPLEVLEQKAIVENRERQVLIDAQAENVREAETMLRREREKLQGLQQEKVTASFAYDAARAQIESEAAAKAA